MGEIIELVMKGLVNYHAEDDEEDYIMYIDKGKNEVLPKMKTVEVTLEDPRFGEGLRFSEGGLTFACFPSKLERIEDVLDDNTKDIYEKELAEILQSKIENIREVHPFDHTIRSN